MVDVARHLSQSLEHTPGGAVIGPHPKPGALAGFRAIIAFQASNITHQRPHGPPVLWLRQVTIFADCFGRFCFRPPGNGIDGPRSVFQLRLAKRFHGLIFVAVPEMRDALELPGFRIVIVLKH